MAEQETEPTTEVWTYQGRRRWLTKGKNTERTVWLWEHADGDGYGHHKQLVTGAHIGARYRFTVTADGRFWTGGDKRPRLLMDAEHPPADPEQVTEWEAADAAAGIEADLAGLERRYGETISGLDQALEPVKRLIWERAGMNRRRRAAIVAAVIAELDRQPSW